MEDAPDIRWQADWDRATQAIADGRFEEAEHIYTAALDHTELRDEYASAILRDLINLYARQVDQLREEQRAFRPHWAEGHEAIHRHWAENRDILRQRGQTLRGLYCKQHACYQRLLELQERMLGPEHIQLADTLLALARLHWDHFDEYNAFPFEWRALAVRERALGPDHPDTLAIVRRLAKGHSILIAFATAGPLWHRLVGSFDRQAAAGVTVDVEGQREAIRELGKSYNAQEEYAAAEKVWRRYLELPPPARFNFGPENPFFTLNTLDVSYGQRLDGLYGAGRACSAQGKWDEAAILLGAAVVLHRQHPHHIADEVGGSLQLGLDAGLHDCANVLRRLGRHGEALLLFEEAQARSRRHGLPFARLLRDYALILRDLRRVDEAVALEQQADAAEAATRLRYARYRARRAE